MSSSKPGSTAILPDYGSSRLDVYTNFVLHCCHTSASADIICRPWAPVPSATALTSSHFNDYQLDAARAPSWIASKDKMPFGNPSLRLTRRIHGKPLVGTNSNRLYNAHYGTKPQVSFGRKDNSNECDGSLHIRGIFLGEILQRSTRMADAIVTKECFDILGWERFGQHPGSSDLPDTAWRVLCAYRDGKGAPAPSQLRRAMVQTIQLRSKALTHATGTVQVTTAPSIDIEELLRNELPDPVRNFLTTTRDVVWNRRTFRGKNHGDNSVILGLAPQQAEVGDQVCILYGCSVPIVLRQHSSRVDHFWQFVGEAYVDGYMNGEKIASMSPASLEAAEVVFEIR